MKKILFKTLSLFTSSKSLAVLLLSLLFSINSFGQIDDEKRLKIQEPAENFEKSAPPGKINCKCSDNVIRDGNFDSLTVSGSDITGTSKPWKKNSNSPQWSSTDGVCSGGAVKMWGNQTVYESIVQTPALIPGVNYKITFVARLLTVNPLEPLVRLKVTSGAANVVSADITSTAWASYTIATILVAGGPDIILQPENNSTLNNGAHVSWIQIDNICIEKVCDITDQKCNPDFKVSAFSLNSQCNVVADFNPSVTGGAEHYWGLLLASGPTDVTPIPLATIMSGGTFGLGISSTGVATPIGMGTGINPSTSGYGYHYEGVGFGTCFKVTHYVKCCNKWYSKTKTYCTKLCSDVRESRGTDELTEVNEINPGAKKVLRQE